MGGAGAVAPASGDYGAMSQITAAADGRPFCEWVPRESLGTVVTGLQQLGMPSEVMESALSHVSESLAGISWVYQRHGWNTEKRVALDA